MTEENKEKVLSQGAVKLVFRPSDADPKNSPGDLDEMVHGAIILYHQFYEGDTVSVHHGFAGNMSVPVMIAYLERLELAAKDIYTALLSVPEDILAQAGLKVQNNLLVNIPPVENPEKPKLGLVN